jgi:hypothetical protein
MHLDPSLVSPKNTEGFDHYKRLVFSAGSGMEYGIWRLFWPLARSLDPVRHCWRSIVSGRLGVFESWHF